MSSHTPDRRDVLTGLAGLGAALVAGAACAQQTPQARDPHEGHQMRDAPPAGPPSAELQAVIDATAGCQRAGRVCLARCTDHLAAGTPMMEHCQRAVMNMLAVVAAMADVAGYRNAAPANMKAMASACAAFCRTCAAACEPHSGHHEECKACMDACLACAKACEDFARA
jgi:Cys-rich four helix bundle protein (predicted Tat secretion target)